MKCLFRIHTHYNADNGAPFGSGSRGILRIKNLRTSYTTTNNCGGFPLINCHVPHCAQFPVSMCKILYIIPYRCRNVVCESSTAKHLNSQSSLYLPVPFFSAILYPLSAVCGAGAGAGGKARLWAVVVWLRGTVVAK